MTPDQVTGLLAALKIPVLPSIDNVAMRGEAPVDADGNAIPPGRELYEPGVTVPYKNGLPRMVVYRRDFAGFRTISHSSSPMRPSTSSTCCCPRRARPLLR